MRNDKSLHLWEQANKVLVGGVYSPVRAFKGVGGTPFFVVSGFGAHITDVDNNVYTDYVLSWGPLVLGHAHPHVVDAVCRTMENGASFGIPTEAEIRLAERIRARIPSIQKLRLVNSGTEATMSAIRLARGYTGRDIIVKAEGCYHGHADTLLAKAGSGIATLGIPTCPGVPLLHAQHTLTMPFNNLMAAEGLFSTHGDNIACIIIEPVSGNMGVVLPEKGYLEGLRALTTRYGALLIFDEVMTGFRVALGGAQERYDITPDLTTLGKVIGGGLPVGAYGGRADIMDHLAPVGPVYQAGTLAGNPLATAAGLATLDMLEKEETFQLAKDAMTTLSEGLGEIARETGVPVFQAQAGSMGCLFFHDGPVRNYADAAKSNTTRYAKFFHGMLNKGVYFAPSQFEACFTSIAHDPNTIEKTLDAAREVFATLK